MARKRTLTRLQCMADSARRPVNLRWCGVYHVIYILTTELTGVNREGDNVDRTCLLQGAVIAYKYKSSEAGVK